MKEAIGRLPWTDHNKRLEKGVSELAREIVSNVNIETQKSMVKAEYELKKLIAARRTLISELHQLATRYVHNKMAPETKEDSNDN